MTTRHQVLLKIIIVGDSAVGKTSLLNRYVMGVFSEEYKATIGADFMTSEIKVDDKSVTLQIWDTAGQERFQSLGNAFYRGADACVLVYDITNEQSFVRIEDWRNNFIEQAAIEDPKSFPFLLVANKCDLEHERAVPTETGKRLAVEWNMQFHETSALTGENVQEAIRNLATVASSQDNVPYFSQEVANQVILEDANINDTKQNAPQGMMDSCMGACQLI